MSQTAFSFFYPCSPQFILHLTTNMKPRSGPVSSLPETLEGLHSAWNWDAGKSPRGRYSLVRASVLLPFDPLELLEITSNYSNGSCSCLPPAISLQPGILVSSYKADQFSFILWDAACVSHPPRILLLYPEWVLLTIWYCIWSPLSNTGHFIPLQLCLKLSLPSLDSKH